MNKKFRLLSGVAIALAQITSATPTPTFNQVETTKTENKDHRQNEAIPTRNGGGMGVELNQYGGLDFDHPRMWRTSPMFDPKRPHPIQSYRSQQRAAKQRKKAR